MYYQATLDQTHLKTGVMIAIIVTHPSRRWVVRADSSMMKPASLGLGRARSWQRP